MFNSDTELLFPPRVIPTLRNLRGKTWQELVDRIPCNGEATQEQLAFILMMARLNNCANCNADTFRAMRGCTQCSRLTIKRHRGSDEDLQALFDAARVDVEQYLDNLNGSK